MINRMNTTQRLIVGSAIAIAVLAITFAAGAAVADQTTVAADPTVVTTTAPDSAPAVDESPTVVEAATGEISQAEAEGLAFMREEEKLARDVYLTLADVWDTKVFSNIAGAEQTHMDAVLDLMDSYELEDPVGDNPIGVFTDSDLQKLFDDLVATGSESLEDALGVGALIEEVDIEDLAVYLESTNTTEIARVYERLLSGSENHLRAFVSQLRQAGVDYEPMILTAEQYDSIIASSNQRGQGGEGHGGEGHGGQRGGQRGRNRTNG